MDFKKITSKDLTDSNDKISFEHFKNLKIRDISLPNQDGNLLRLNRLDTFRVVIYCYPMTGRPDKPLPPNWNSIPGTQGCTLQNCSFRDSHDEFLALNSIPIGLSTQSVNDIKEMTSRLSIPFDIVSDEELIFTNLIKLPTFKIQDKVYVKRITMIIEKSIIKHIIYPISEPNSHVKEVLYWLKKN